MCFFFCTMLVTLVGNVIVLQWSALFSSLSRSTLVPATQHTRGFQITMVLFSQLICSTCRKILTFPLGAISCRCRNCQTVNPTVHMEVPCSCCGSLMLAPPNTTLVLCPCCTTVTEIPVDLLPPIPEPVNVDGEDEKSAKTIYVELPAAGPQQGGRAGGRPQQGPILVATKIL